MGWFDKKSIQARRKNRAARRAEKQLRRTLRRERKYFQRRLIDGCTQWGAAYMLRAELRPTKLEGWITGKRAYMKMRFIPPTRGEAQSNQGQHFFQIDTTRLPYGVRLFDFQDEEFLFNLSHVCQRNVKFVANKEQPECGVWLVVEREGAIGGVPRLVKFRDTFAKLVEARSAPLAFAVGVAANYRLIVKDMGEVINLLIAGSPGGGKSVFVNQMICTWLRRNPPDRLKFVMIDLKAGLEFQDYEDIPHLWRPVVSDTADVLPTLEALSREIQRRASKFKTRKVRSLQQWNARSNEREPAIVLFIDEVAQIVRDLPKKISGPANEQLLSILSLGRAVGVYCVLSTQRPSTDVIGGGLKGIMSGRLSFGQPDQYSSQTVIRGSGAQLLEYPGRGIFQYGLSQWVVQAPWINGAIIRRTVRLVMEHEYKQAEVREDVTLESVARYALENLDGSLSRRALMTHFKGAIGHGTLQAMLAEADGTTIDIDGQQYGIVDHGPPIGRRLVLYPNGHESGSVGTAIGTDFPQEVIERS